MSMQHTVLLVGNPNAGKTTLFNALTGLRTQTANFPGTTVERKTGVIKHDGLRVNLVDLPGMYSLQAATEEEKLARDIFTGKIKGFETPDACVFVLDASNMERNLFLLSQILEYEIPVLVAANMMDVADRHGVHVDLGALSEELQCPVLPVCARDGEGVPALRDKLFSLLQADEAATFRIKPACSKCVGCPFQARFDWGEEIAARSTKPYTHARSGLTEKIDKLLTHKVFGLGIFTMVMLGIFYLIFSAAAIPMDLIDHWFGAAGGFLEGRMPDNDLRSFLVNGLIGGVGGILVFLPQICILFFFLALLEDTGYLARAAFVMDKLMRRLGLPGTAFVPMVSAHACALPAIMSTRIIGDWRDRLVTILVLPLFTCSARIPVYAMVTALLFPSAPGMAALVFTAAYLLGIVAALVMAWIFKKTILPGESKPLVLELPGYKLPSLKNALLQTYDRAKVFVQGAGTTILVISIILWALATYPKHEASSELLALEEQGQTLVEQGQMEEGQALLHETAVTKDREALAHSFAGRLGKIIEPVVRPLGFDWQIGIGVVSSFAAREVIVSTLAIVYGIGEGAVDEEQSLYASLRQAKRPDGTLVFNLATGFSLLVFYVLAMQCLPTQVVTKRETGSWKWAAFQFAYMTVLAYVAALVTYQGITYFYS